MTALGRVLVTGSTGAIGWNVVGQLHGRAEAIRALVRDPARARKVVPGGIELVTGDLTDPASLDAAVAGCDAVFHTAGMPEQWLRDPAQFDAVNAEGTRLLGAAALKAGVANFIYVSTIDVFERPPGAPFDESVIEARPLGTAYERSKQAADRIVVELMEQGLPARFIHPSAVYGPSPSPTPGVNDFLERVMRNRAPALPPGGMPLVFAPDVARGTIAAAAAPVGERFILSDRYVPMRELADLVRELEPGARRPPAMPLPVARGLARAGEAVSRVIKRPPLLPHGQLVFLTSHSVPDASHAHEALGWAPTPLREGIAETVAEIRRRRSG